MRKDSVSHSREVLNTVKFRHRTWNMEQPICLMGTGVLDLQGQCSRDLLHNTLSCTLEEEERREEKRP